MVSTLIQQAERWEIRKTVSQTLLFEESRGTGLHVYREQDEQGEEDEPSHKIDQRTLRNHSQMIGISVSSNGRGGPEVACVGGTEAYLAQKCPYKNPDVASSTTR